MLKINGMKDILGHEIKIIEGGFGPGQRVLFDTQIAEIHNMETKEVRKSINRLIDKGRLKDNVDFIDVLQRSKRFITFDLTELYAKQAITQAKNIFILPEKGYSKFIKSINNYISEEKGKMIEEIMRKYFESSTPIIINEGTRKEIEFIEDLENILGAINVKGKKQYYINGYRIDYYIPLYNIAIEYDENGHKNYTYSEHEGRQKEIEKELRCKFIRVSDNNKNSENIAVILKYIMNLKNRWLYNEEQKLC